MPSRWPIMGTPYTSIELMMTTPAWGSSASKRSRKKKKSAKSSGKAKSSKKKSSRKRGKGGKFEKKG